MQSTTDVQVDRRAQSHTEIDALVESRNGALTLLGELASKQPFIPDHDTQLLLQNFCESLIDYTASAHFQLYRHLDEEKERRGAVIEVAEQVYSDIAESTQIILDFNDKYDCEDHCKDLSHLAADLSKLAELLADRIEHEDQVVSAMRSPRLV